MTPLSKYDKLVQRIFWFSLPLIIALLSYLVITMFIVQVDVAKISTSNTAVVENTAKMWELVNENNSILHFKADQESNEREHKAICDKLDAVEASIQKVSRMVGILVYTPEPVIDTVYIIPYKDITMVDANNYD
jgi:small-conductance mechanosensitive channel